jgi:hypothetical protein
MPQIERLRMSVFISYSSRDRAFVDKLEAGLIGMGIRAWRDIRDLKVGESVYKTIAEAIRMMPIFLVVISKHSLRSRWVQDELSTAFHARVEGEKEIFPVIIRGVSIEEIPHDLRKFQWADFRKDFDGGLAQISTAIEALCGRIG